MIDEVGASCYTAPIVLAVHKQTASTKQTRSASTIHKHFVLSPQRHKTLSNWNLVTTLIPTERFFSNQGIKANQF